MRDQVWRQEASSEEALGDGLHFAAGEQTPLRAQAPAHARVEATGGISGKSVLVQVFGLAGMLRLS